MAALTSRFAIDHGRIRLADAVLVHLERTLANTSPLPPGVAPRPYGLAPPAVSPSGSVLAAVAPGEAVWLGFQAVDSTSPAIVRVRVDRSSPLDAVTGGRWEDALVEAPRNHLVCPPDYCLPGLREPAGHMPFGHGDASRSTDVLEELTVLAYGATAGHVIIRLVTPDTFTSITGMVPEPIDPDSAYKGWRLP